MQTLSGQNGTARHTAAQVIAKVGAIEVPEKQWTELVDGLLANVANTGFPGVVYNSLEALGYLCEELDVGDLSLDQVGRTLEAIITGMDESSPPEIRRYTRLHRHDEISQLI